MGQKVSVLYITSNLSFGGMERSLYYLLKSADRTLFTVSVWSLSGTWQELAGPIRDLGHELRVWGIEKVNSWGTVKKLPALARDLRARRPQVLVCHSFDAELVGVPLGRLLGVPVIVTTRRDLGDWPGAARSLRWQRWLNRGASRIVAVSERVKAAVVAREKLQPARVTTIYNGIDEKLFDHSLAVRTRLAWGIAEHDTVVTLVASVVYAVKGHRQFIEAARLVLDRDPHVTFMVVGYVDRAAGLFRELQTEIRQHGIDARVIFTGPTGHVTDILAFSDICVNASLSEGMSNAILEYMAMGKPVVATDAGGNPEVVLDGLTGLVVPAGNAPALAEAILKLVHDRKLRKTMGEHGRARLLAGFTAARMARDYEKLYWELLEGR